MDRVIVVEVRWNDACYHDEEETMSDILKKVRCIPRIHYGRLVEETENDILIVGEINEWSKVTDREDTYKNILRLPKVLITNPNSYKII